MDRQAHIFAIAAFGVVSGLFSPLASLMIVVLSGLAPGIVAPTAGIVLATNAIATAMLTIMLGGIPAALYERIAGKPETDTTSWFLWLAGTAIVALPAVGRAASIVLG